MSPTRTCPWPGCAAQLYGELLACAAHFRRLSPADRAAIWAAYKARFETGDAAVHAAVAAVVREAARREAAT